MPRRCSAGVDIRSPNPKRLDSTPPVPSKSAEQQPGLARPIQLAIALAAVILGAIIAVRIRTTADQTQPTMTALIEANTETPARNVTPNLEQTSGAPRLAGAGSIVAGAGGGPYSHMGYAFTASEWHETKHETTIIVMAGASRDFVHWQDIGAGVVLVIEQGPQGRHTSKYETGTTGELIFIVDAVGERLILRTQSGRPLYFDVPARQFVDGLTVTAPPVENTPFVTATSTPCNTTMPPVITRPPTNTPEPFVSGIFTSQRFQQMGYSFTNWWTDMVNGEQVEVIAGARQDSPGASQSADAATTKRRGALF
jgi:hypothetical protein